MLFALALLGAAVRAPDAPAFAGSSLSAMRAAFLAVVPDRAAAAVRPIGSAGNRQWLANASRDGAAGAPPGQVATALAAADTAIVGRHGGRAAQARQDPPRRPSAAPFGARAPPAAV